MGRRRRNAALRHATGIYHVASRLAFEGFNATVARGSDAGTDVLAGLPGRSATAALAVRTAECPSGFGDEDAGRAVACEWRVGKGPALAGESPPFVALDDLGRYEGLPRVWVVPSRKIRAHLGSPDGPGRFRYRSTEKGLAPHENDWDAVGDHLMRNPAPQTGCVDRRELAELYGDEFVEGLDIEASRLLGAENSTVRRMADGRFTAEELAETSALLRVLFRRRMEGGRRRPNEGRGGGA